MHSATCGAALRSCLRRPSGAKRSRLGRPQAGAPGRTGALSDYRLSRLIKYSFYKNIAFSFSFFFYQFFNGWSGQARAPRGALPPRAAPAAPSARRPPRARVEAGACLLTITIGMANPKPLPMLEAQATLDGVTAAFYNAFFTSLPIGAFALFDRPLRRMGLLQAHPEAYNRRPPLTAGAFWKTGVATAVAHGLARPRRAGRHHDPRRP